MRLMLLALCLGGAARAADVAADELERVPRLRHLTPAARLDVIERQLTLEQTEAATWYFGWSIGWSALAVGQLLTYPTYTVRERPSYWAWSIGSLVGAGSSWLFQPVMVSSRSEFQRLRVDPSMTEDERLVALERLWVMAHDDEVMNRAWWQQLICVGTNVLPFMVLGLGWQQWDWGYLLLGIVSSELQIFSFPQLLRRFGIESRLLRALEVMR